jgi:hypothetical protein
MRNSKAIKTILVPLCLSSLLGSAALAGEISLHSVFASLRRDLAAARGSYFVPDQLVSNQIIMGLGIPHPTIQVSDGNYLVSGCRPHSCDEKAGVIITPNGNVLAAGLINFHCHRELTKQVGVRISAVICDSYPSLTIFVRRDIEMGQRSGRAELKLWGEREAHLRTSEINVFP